MSKKKKKQRHKYLNQLGIASSEIAVFNTTDTDFTGDSSRMKRFRKQRKKYGFDEREIWDLDYTLISWLYSHLRMYVEKADIDFTYHHFNVPVLVEIPEGEREMIGESRLYAKRYQREEIADLSMEEALNIAMQYMAAYLKDVYGGDEEDSFKALEKESRAKECAQCALKIVAEILPALWW